MRTLMFTVVCAGGCARAPRMNMAVLERNLHEHRRALPRHASDNDFAAEQGGAFAHAEQANGFGVGNLGLRDAASVVHGFEHELAAVLLQMNGHFGGVSVTNDV